VGHTSRSSGFLRMKASLARVSQSGLKTGGGAMTGGACGTIVEVVSDARGKWTGRCDGLRWTLVPYL
jgi:hypothetical protein